MANSWSGLRKQLEEVDQQPEWLQFFYLLRLEAEGIPVSHAEPSEPGGS